MKSEVPLCRHLSHARETMAENPQKQFCRISLTGVRYFNFSIFLIV
jgi:hypothetical protein